MPSRGGWQTRVGPCSTSAHEGVFVFRKPLCRCHRGVRGALAWSAMGVLASGLEPSG